ncbi:MAG: hypothetical protein IJ228_13075 [Succinivibrio sp.]|nr:hypothetical protein [Succinivibrio sp.]
MNINSLNTGAVTTNVIGRQGAEARPQAAAKGAEQPQGSSVVELNGKLKDTQVAGSVAANSENAASLASDVASLLGSRGGAVQSNLNGFDAARLLAG